MNQSRRTTKEKKYVVTPYEGGGHYGSDEKKFPNVLRAIIVGSSNCGKTTLLMNFIYKDWLNYQYLYVFSKSLDQPLYKTLQERYSQVECEIGHQISFFFDKCEDVISVDECKPNSLAVFDDCLLEKQGEIKHYFTRGRHKKISCIYLSQCYNLVDRQVIRNNANMIFVFPQNKHYLKNIYNDYVGSDMSLTDFTNLCNSCWEANYGFLTINLTKKRDEGKYLNQLNEICLLKR